MALIWTFKITEPVAKDANDLHQIMDTDGEDDEDTNIE